MKNTCLILCPAGFYPLNGVCNPCDNSCLQCQGDGPLNCTLCESPFVLNAGSCSDSSKNIILIYKILQIMS